MKRFQASRKFRLITGRSFRGSALICSEPAQPQLAIQYPSLPLAAFKKERSAVWGSLGAREETVSSPASTWAAQAVWGLLSEVARPLRMQ